MKERNRDMNTANASKQAAIIMIAIKTKHFFRQKVVLLMASTLLSLNPVDARAQPSGNTPVRVAVAGITHGHVSWILNRKNKTGIELVGIYEANSELSERYARQFGINKDLFYKDLDKMLDIVKPEAVVAFGSVYQHLRAVEACAPRGIHVMVEKPLAASLDHALRMEALANKHHIYLLTNYETSWYPTTEKTFQLIHDSNYIGHIKKTVFHHGHNGPMEIGVNKEFLEWLTDPVQNGGGAVIDFGCYGANLMTYLMKGANPVSVTAVLKQFKPTVYPKVDDEATIIVSYQNAQVIIQASWNWPFSRKDMEVYGESGYIIAQNSNNMLWGNQKRVIEQATAMTVSDAGVYQDPFLYFADVIRKKITVPEHGLYSLSNNITVMRILEAAKVSAKTGKIVPFQK